MSKIDPPLRPIGVGFFYFFLLFSAFSFLSLFFDADIICNKNMSSASLNKCCLCIMSVCEYIC